VAGIASQLFGWRAAFLVAGLGALGALAVLLLSGRPTEAPLPIRQDEIDIPPSHLQRRSPVWLDILLANIATFALFFITGGVFQSVLPLFGSGLGLDVAGIGLILGIATGLRVLVSVLGSIVSDKRGRHGVMLVGFVLTFVALLAFPHVNTIAAFALVAWIASIGRVGNTMPIAVLSDRVPDSDHGRWISRNRFIADLALLVGPITLGIVIDAAGFEPAFYLTAALVGVVLLLMIVEWRANRVAQPQTI
jgi:ACS family D-galactonate transporter-like MFS transporter